jgi:TetR/AcrR family transcriptional regulator, lmrAB and yxaGH operons repressor
MPAPLISKDEVVARLTRVFREVGYEAASLTELSKATGLQKASLYHYFPGGKEEMAQAVLNRANAWVAANALQPLSGAGTPAKRLQRMISALDSFYAGGQDSCLLGLLAIGSARDVFHGTVRAALAGWASAITAVLEDAGIPPDVARRRGEDAVIVSRGLASNKPFSRTLRDMPGQLLEPVAKAKKKIGAGPAMRRKRPGPSNVRQAGLA